MAKNNTKENIRIREILMQAAFQMESTKNGSKEQLSVFLMNQDLTDEQYEYVTKVFLTLVDKIDDIDFLINRYSREWTTDRMIKTDLAILRLAICEMFFAKEHPAPIVINDAVNMAKKFSNEDSYKFINGILGNIYRKEIENGDN